MPIQQFHSDVFVFPFDVLALGYGFNSGSALMIAIPEKGMVEAVTTAKTTLAAAADAVLALFLNMLWEECTMGEYTFDIIFFSFWLNFFLDASLFHLAELHRLVSSRYA